MTIKLLLSKEIEKDEKFPYFVRADLVFKKIKAVRKIFPEIGLGNYTESIELQNTDAVDAADDLIVAIKNACYDRVSTLERFLARGKVGQVRKDFAMDLIEVFSIITKSENKDFVVSSDKGIISIVLPSDVMSIREGQSSRVLFKKGMGLFKLYGKINDNLTKHEFLPLPLLDSLQEYKDFSSKNLPSKGCSIVFSSVGRDGFWDILTMSQRGITSCQTWETANEEVRITNNHIRVIGSAVEPMTGIIYLTNGRDEGYGSKMMRRCIVRYVLNAQGDPTILLEKMYPSFDNDTLATFKKSIQNRFSGKVVYVNDAKNNPDDALLASKYISPSSPELKMLHSKVRPYIDSGVVYSKSMNVGLPFVKNTDNVKGLFIDHVSSEYLKVLKSPKTYGDLQDEINDKLSPFAARFFDKLQSKEKGQKVIFASKRVVAVDFARFVSLDLANISFSKYTARNMRLPEIHNLIEAFASYILQFKVEQQAAYRLASKIAISFRDNRLYN